MDQNDIANMPRNDQAVLGLGVLVFIASFFPYYGASGSFLGQHASSSTTAWHSYATLALLLLIASTAVAAVKVFGGANLPDLPVGWNMIVLGLSALGTVLLIIRSFTLDSGHIAGFEYGLRWGAYVLMVLAVLHTFVAYMSTRASGEAMPWASSSSDSTAPPA